MYPEIFKPRTTVEKREVNWLLVVAARYSIFKEWLRSVSESDGVEMVTRTEFFHNDTFYRARFVAAPHQMRGLPTSTVTVIYLDGWETNREIREILTLVKANRFKVRHMSMSESWS